VSAEPAPGPRVDAVCPLCGVVAAPAASRCESCGMSLEGVGNRPAPFTRHTIWFWAAGLLVVYLIALVVVATVHD
jgi:hypothetical protein